MKQGLEAAAEPARRGSRMTEHQSKHAQPDGLVDLVREQIGLYEKLEELSLRQHGLVETEDTDALLAVLGERQRLIEDISAVASRMTPYRAGWDDHVGKMDEDEKQSLRQGLDSLASMMARIANRDEHDRRTMEDRRQRVQSQIAGVKRGGAAVKSYGQAQPRGPRFQDREA